MLYTARILWRAIIYLLFVKTFKHVLRSVKLIKTQKKWFGYIEIIHTCFVICVSTSALKYHTLVKTVSKLILT